MSRGRVGMLRGCGTAIVTPFGRDGLVDEGALRALVDWQVEEGVHFLVPCGTTGEAVTLTPRERSRVVEVVAERVRGRVPVVAGATSNDTRAAAEEAVRMRDAGADQILSATPYYNKPTPAGMIGHFEAVSRAAERPLILYNVPGRTAVNMDAGTTLRLARDPGIAGIKEASGNLEQIMEILAGRPEDFAVLSGDDALAFPLLALGGDGVISVVSNQAPGPMARMVDAFHEGSLSESRAIHYRLLDLMKANFLESNPIPVKAGLSMMGRIEDRLRPPLTPLSDPLRPVLESALEKAGVLPGERT